MEKLNPKIEITKEMEYLFFARSFLILSYRGIEEVLKNVQGNEFSNPFGKIKPDWVYKNNYLLIPAVYNLKHAMEIFIKTLMILLKIEPEKIHDNKKLFQKLKDKIIGKTVEELELLINKYYYNDFLKNKIDIGLEVNDKKNDIFRYPENSIKMPLDFFGFYQDLQ